MKLLNRNSISFFICLILAVLIMLNHNPKSVIYNYAENKLLDVTSPAIKSGSSILYFFRNIGDEIFNAFNNSEENKKLKERNDFLEYYFYQFKQIEAENKLLKEELIFTKNMKHKYITAQVIGRNSNSFIQQIIIDGGLKQGIKKGQMVLSHNQLIGRIAWIGDNVAKVLLLTDQTSRVPVTAINSRTKFVIEGQSKNYFSCKYLNEQPNLLEGELVTTNGDDVLIATGIMVGAVFKENGNFYVKPNIDFDKIEFVQVLTEDE